MKNTIITVVVSVVLSLGGFMLINSFSGDSGSCGKKKYCCSKESKRAYGTKKGCGYDEYKAKKSCCAGKTEKCSKCLEKKKLKEEI